MIPILLAAGLAALPSVALAAGPHAQDEAIVKTAPNADIEALCADFGAQVVAAIPSGSLYLLVLPLTIDGETFIDLMETDPRVVHAELNGDAHSPIAVGGDTQPFFFGLVPPIFEDQYALDLLNLDAAHSLSVGHGAVVALLDTGIDAGHELLAGHVLPGGYNFVDGTADTADVADGIDQDGDGASDEMVGHGTMIAGVIAIVAPQAGILPVKVLDSDGKSSVFRIAQGIFHAVDQGAHIINLSLGTHDEALVLHDAVQYAESAGVLVVASAGNENTYFRGQMPAANEHVVAVAATDAQDIKAAFSNYGDGICLSAPGTNLVSSLPGNQYALASGTSLSAAFVSGAAALLKAHDAQATADEIVLAMATSAFDLDDLNPAYAGQLGAGRIDAAAALAAFAGDSGDVDGDGHVGPDDLVIVVRRWGEQIAAGGSQGGNAAGFHDLMRVVLGWN